MKLKQIILISCQVLLACSVHSAYAFSNCQVKYDSDKRSIPALRGMCNVCHLSENGSGPQNEFGRAFASAGFKITDELVAKFPNFFQKQISDNTVTEKPFIKRIKPNKIKTNVQTMISIMGQNFVSGAKTFVDNNEVIT